MVVPRASSTDRFRAYLEPAIGSLVAYWVFDTELVGTLTWVGGSVLLFALMLVGYGGLSESCDGGSTGTSTGTSTGIGIGNGEKEVRGVEMGSRIGAGAGAGACVLRTPPRKRKQQ